MTPEQLKLSILQSAFQGKLTGECLPNETADDLYQQIQSEKQRLISEKKIKKEKPLPEISADEMPFDIPDNWRWCYVGDLFLHNTGKAQNSFGSTNGTIRKFITTSNLYWGEFDFTKVKEMPFTDAELERCTVKKGDLLVCEGGDCGRSAVWSYDEEVCIQNHVHRLRPYRDVNIYYFYYLFYLYKNTGRLRGRGVAIQGLSNEAIHKVVLPLAPLEEQHRIVAKIEELLPYVDRYAAAYEKLEQFNAKFPEDMKKSILQYAIQGKLVEQRPAEGTGEELYRQIVKNRELLIERKVIKRDKRTETAIDPNDIPFDVPENWKWVTLGSILNKLTDGTHKTPKYTTNGIKFVSVKDMSNGVLSLENTKFISAEEHQELYARCNPEKGDILLSKVGTTGVPAIVNTTEQFSLFVSIALLKFDRECIDLKFLYYMLMSPLVQTQATENTRGVGNKNWVLDAIANTMVVLPPLAEQKRIVAKLEEILPLCERLK